MNIKITDLDMILQRLDITSLEPHDDYTSEFTYKDQKILHKYITDLQQENKQQKDNWNKLKEFIAKEYYMYLPLEASTKSITILINKMQELEKGSDSNG